MPTNKKEWLEVAGLTLLIGIVGTACIIVLLVLFS